ncbi:MAG TPA: sigma-70 family RNA polymerase sigma factor [Verrucomicrobiae bacterium]|nr:sigma-70 family RNA polymerase sigma factor [Verrucomicrobiae bacterium]
MNDSELLKEFVERDNQSAFRTVMERHLPLVYGTARRTLANSALAEDVTQTVFLLLARKARADMKLAGWLYNTTRFVAARALRSELRRARREQEAASMNDPDPTWQNVVPKLDDALASLSETDRSAILFRFFEQQGLREVGEALGVSEEAAKKRVARALDKLRRILGRRGIDVSAGALVAGLTYEASALPAGLAGNLTAATLAKIASAETTGLLVEVLAALRWAKIKLFGTAAAGIAIIALLVPAVSTRWARSQDTTATQSSSRETSLVTAATPGVRTDPTRFRGLRLTVLDETSDQPVPGAEVTHTLMAWGDDNTPLTPMRTDANGVAQVRIPTWLPEPTPREQFEVFIHANAYARKSIMWLSTTGGVLAIVTNDYTVKLERGIALSGTVVEESGQPLFGVLVGAIGNDYRGSVSYRNHEGVIVSPPEFRVEELGTYSAQASATGPNAIITDYQGRFELPHCPRNLEGLHLDFVLPDGSRRKFRTPMGARLSTESLPEISIQELRSGTARFVIARGVTVEGLVVDANGEPVSGATVTESILVGNVRELARNKTDQFGQFRLENRPAREVILSAMGGGHATLSGVVNIQRDMKPLRLQLPVEQPLRGTVLDESGQPIEDAKIYVPDYRNDGIALEWKGRTDAEGRFIWRAAPTNELVVFVEASGYTERQARVQSSASNNVITLVSGIMDTIRITGRVTDDSSGEPVERFKAQVHAGGATLPEYLKHAVEGRDGVFEAIVPVKVFDGGINGGWVLQIVADGYDPHMSTRYYVAEGDKHLEVKLDAGGTIEGVVLAPDGAMAANAALAIAQQGESALAHRNGELSPHRTDGRSDATGHFRLTKPLKALTLVVFHESGWAVAPVRTGRQELRVQLQPWARVEGVLMRGGKPLAREGIALHSLAKVADHTLQVLYNTSTDSEGGFAFERVPEGEFNVSWNPIRWRMKDMPNLYTLEQTVTVRSGDIRRTILGEAGVTVAARLELPTWLAGHSLTNVRALLWKGLPTPPLPNPSRYATRASLNAAILNHHRDSAALAAKRSQQHYLGDVAPDGMVVFPDIPPGRYILEAELFDFGATKRLRFNEVPVAARLVTSVTIRAESEGAVELGEFVLSSAN